MAAGEIVKYESQRLVLHTDVDRPPRRSLRAFESAGRPGCVNRPTAGRMTASRCGLPVRDGAPEKFSDAGLLPKSIERFLAAASGKTPGEPLLDEGSVQRLLPRHLMIHEATHCFMTARGGTMLPVWYLEGTAELFATHVTDASSGQFRFGVMPTDTSQLPGWGRLGMLRRDVRRGRLPRFAMLSGVLENRHEKIRPMPGRGPIAVSWRPPPLRVRFPGDWASTSLTGGSTRRWNDVRSRSDALQLSGDWQPGTWCPVSISSDRQSGSCGPGPWADGTRTVVVADPGVWESTGVRVEKGRGLKWSPTGGSPSRGNPGRGSDADGISSATTRDCRWAGWSGGAAGPRIGSPPRVVSLGRDGRLLPRTSGTLFLRLNDFLSELADNTGTVTVEIRNAKR
ncbi:MAG: hypothetical protein Ct9H300mP1_20720 [Planctomycetaceae bacterium]|nr:MAG: hypothetical protein Ct9H300mP1_20720 [Planctomycetaceae bacterium]